MRKANHHGGGKGGNTEERRQNCETGQHCHANRPTETDMVTTETETEINVE